MFLNQKFLLSFVLQQSEGINSTSSSVSGEADLFTLIHEPEVVVALKRWFKLKSPTGFGEQHLLSFLRELTDFPDFKILDIFDAWDATHRGALLFEEFFVLLALLVARSTCKLTQFLYIYGSQLTNLFAIAPADTEAPAIPTVTVLFVGFLLDIESVTQRANAVFDLDHEEALLPEKFLVVMFWVFIEFEKMSRDCKSTRAIAIVPKGTSAGTRFKSKACTIL